MVREGRERPENVNLYIREWLEHCVIGYGLKEWLGMNEKQFESFLKNFNKTGDWS
jgi:hypothetical protein